LVTAKIRIAVHLADPISRKIKSPL